MAVNVPELAKNAIFLLSVDPWQNVKKKSPQKQKQSILYKYPHTKKNKKKYKLNTKKYKYMIPHVIWNIIRSYLNEILCYIWGTRAQEQLI